MANGPPWRGLFSGLLMCASSLALGQSAYNVELPPNIHTAPDLCGLVDCAAVLPQATEFSERKGSPSYVEGYAVKGGQRTLAGYVMLSTDITDIPAYSGKPVVTLIGMDTRGRFTGIKILKHSEPILLLGIPESALLQFNAQYIGKSAGNAIEVGRGSRRRGAHENTIGVDAISGATVTVIAQNQVIMTAGATTARQAGILPPEARPPARLLDLRVPLSWADMLKEGSVQQLRVSPEAVASLPSAAPQPDGTPFIALQFGYLNQPDIGRAILGEKAWKTLMNRLGEGEHAIFVVRTGGQESFKGSGFVRGGLYDRIQVRQGHDVFTFRDLDYLGLYGLAAPDAPAYTESAIFIIRNARQGAGFSGAYPWQLVFLGSRVDTATGQRSFVNFDQTYWLPGRYLQEGRPRIDRPAAPWLRVWQARQVEIGVFAAFLLLVAAVYGQRERLTRKSTHKNKWPVNAFRYSVWVFSIGYAGFYLMAQPSITQVLTWLHSLLRQWRWTLFLSDPFIFIFWIFIIATVLVWGRGFFCGWLCPFGALTELLYKTGGRVGLKRWQFGFPAAWHHRLKWIKYAVFIGLLGVSIHSMVAAEMLAEVEPFKTTFLVCIFNRSWPYALFASGLLALSIFTERPFCKYLCPLGAALAVPGTFRWIGLPRKAECHGCTACAKGCGAQAIDPQGRIDMRECMLCLDCMTLYTDASACPPLALERKRRQTAGQPLTPIDARGHFIAIAPEAQLAVHDSMAAHADPRLLTAPVAPPPWLGGQPRACAVLRDVLDHLWPWTRAAFAREPLLNGAALALAVAALCACGAAVARPMPAALGMAGWTLWSALEILLRMRNKPYVREGRWWRPAFRQATWMDMACYVAFKNLLLGAALFLALKSSGLLQGAA
jgi:NosR/NirI family nitrous oxide reductase transcriptional regulator